MNVVIFDFSNNLGGAETFNCRFVNYLVERGDSVAIVGYKDSTLFTLIENDHILIKKYIVPEMDDFFVSISEQSYLSALGQTIIDGFSGQEIYVLASYIDALHKAMYVFNGDARVRLSTGMLHPEAWSIWEPGIGFNSARAFKPKIINRLWHYQRQLLLRLDRNNAIWYLNDTHRKYNEYYFEVELTFNGSVAIPVEPSYCTANISYSTPISEIRVLWLGRFDFFKNPCILKFIDELENLLIERADLEITFDLIGYGVGCYEREIKSYAEIKKERLNINFLGKKKVSDLCKVVESGGYHFGLAMGTSAYHLAMMGLPVVVIEACANGYQKFMRAMWLDDASEEYDDGSALYLALAGKHVNKRIMIKDLLSDVFVDGFLINKSKSCHDYVEKYHSVDILMPKIRNLLLNSTYCERFVYTFDENMPDEFYYRFGKTENISVAIFGIGSGAIKFKGKLDAEINATGRRISIKYFIDNNESMVGGFFYDIEIVSPSDDRVKYIDAIMVASDYWVDIYSQLLELGVQKHKIIRVY